MSHATAPDARAAAERIGTLLGHTSIALENGRHIQVTLKTGIAELADGDDAAALIGRAFEHMERYGLRRAS
jgi:GGDEF domain-containing protein